MINVVCGIRSTGRICTDIADALTVQGHEVKIAYGREIVPEKYQKYAVRIGSDLGVKLHGLRARLLDGAGFGSKADTKKFIEWVKEYDPDVIHLHNIHGYYINVEVLFDYLRICGKKIIWTLHDCWAFTGHCAYFDYVNCNKWEKGCGHCHFKTVYPHSLTDNSRENWKKKKKLFADIPNMTLVTPSNWLADLASHSYMKEYEAKVIYNGVNTDIFKSTPSNIKVRYGIVNKKVVLGVAAIWSRRKGLDFMIDLAEMLGDEFKVVVIGVTEKQRESLPENVLGVLRTNSVQELVEWYSAAEVFVNPTLEDNYPTTNLEAQSCGIPCITFKTGGSIESVPDENIIEQGDLKRCIELLNSKLKLSNQDFGIGAMVQQYIDLYQYTL